MNINSFDKYYYIIEIKQKFTRNIKSNIEFLSGVKILTD